LLNRGTKTAASGRGKQFYQQMKKLLAVHILGDLQQAPRPSKLEVASCCNFNHAILMFVSKSDMAQF